MKKGIDISSHQNDIDFAKVKADGVEFAIIRSSFRKSVDRRFFEYVEGCKTNNISILGIYHFIYALDEAAALEEAKFCVEQALKAGLSKDTYIFSDFEYDSVKKAAAKGVTLGRAECNKFTQIFCEYVESQGFKAGIYFNIDYYKNWYDHNLLDKYAKWLADYTDGPNYPCLIQQFTSKGKVDGISTKVDMNYFYGDDRMDNLTFVNKIKDVADNYKTLYVMGCFGAPMTAANKKRYCYNHSFNKKAARTQMIQAASSDTFGFDCVCLIKGILWGWTGNKTKTYGGAKYAVNGVPDIGANAMIKKCTDISTDFSTIEVGEVVWMDGHIGVYVGDGLVVESSPKWANGVQYTACNRNVSGYNRRDWVKHGKLPYINYVEEIKENTTTEEDDIKMRTIKRGSKGKAVQIWQIIVGAEPDSNFGPDTEVRTYEFQKKAFPNNPEEWDKVVGPKTWKAGFATIK